MRYYPAGSNGSNYWVYLFDPQGNAIQKQGQTNSTYPLYSVTSYDPYGARSPEVYTGGGASPHRDPVGFGGQWGYYTDYETGPGNSVAGSSLLLLTHRYYDPATGRFVNRDPIGYDGGINLYGFAAGNPISRRDSPGLDYGGDMFPVFYGYGHEIPNRIWRNFETPPFVDRENTGDKGGKDESFVGVDSCQFVFWRFSVGYRACGKPRENVRRP